MIRGTSTAIIYFDEIFINHEHRERTAALLLDNLQQTLHDTLVDEASRTEHMRPTVLSWYLQCSILVKRCQRMVHLTNTLTYWHKLNKFPPSGWKSHLQYFLCVLQCLISKRVWDTITGTTMGVQHLYMWRAAPVIEYSGYKSMALALKHMISQACKARHLQQFWWHRGWLGNLKPYVPTMPLYSTTITAFAVTNLCRNPLSDTFMILHPTMIDVKFDDLNIAECAIIVIMCNTRRHLDLLLVTCKRFTNSPVPFNWHLSHLGGRCHNPILLWFYIIPWLARLSEFRVLNLMSLMKLCEPHATLVSLDGRYNLVYMHRHFKLLR